MLQKPLYLPRVERKRVNIGLFNLLFDQVLGVLLMLSPELIGHPLKFLEEPPVLLELLKVLLLIGANNA